MTRKDPSWWALCVLHNCVVHPWLPLADAMQAFGFKRIPAFVFWLHDHSAPPGGG